MTISKNIIKTASCALGLGNFCIRVGLCRVSVLNEYSLCSLFAAVCASRSLKICAVKYMYRG